MTDIYQKREQEAKELLGWSDVKIARTRPTDIRAALEAKRSMQKKEEATPAPPSTPAQETMPVTEPVTEQMSSEEVVKKLGAARNAVTQASPKRPLVTPFPHLPSTIGYVSNNSKPGNGLTINATATKDVYLLVNKLVTSSQDIVGRIKEKKALLNGADHDETTILNASIARDRKSLGILSANIQKTITRLSESYARKEKIVSLVGVPLPIGIDSVDEEIASLPTIKGPDKSLTELMVILKHVLTHLTDFHKRFMIGALTL